MAQHAHHHHHHHRHEGRTYEYPEQNPSSGAKWIKHLTQSRIGGFTGGHFSDVNLSSVLFTRREDGQDYVKLQVWSAPGRSKPGFEEAMKQKFKPAKKGDSFGPSWSNHWWKVSVTIPPSWQQYERVQFEFDPGCEAMIFATDGTPLQAITGGFGGERRVDYIITPEARAEGYLDFVIESSCNGMFGVPWDGDTISPPDMDRYFALASADLVVPNQEAWRLLWDFQTLREIVETLPGNTPLQNKALAVANEIMNVFQKGTSSDISKARRVAEQIFGENWEEPGAEIYLKNPKRAIVWGLGYCHIDTAWLWPFSVTQQKVARSWATQVDLMDRYPEHRFTCSAAQHYKWLEELYPKLFDRVKQKIKSGQFQPVGGSWVENDANMPSGEGLIRQLLYGQRYFESRFGIRCETAWLPDSFGMTGALPQICRGAGMPYFFTQKLSWNNINRFPHSTFNWVGIDGTQVLCHMTPVDSYNAQATVGDVNKAVTNHKNLESSETSLLVFGNGDGGGGPLSKMLENLRRIRAVNDQHTELPVVKMGISAEDFFEQLLKETEQGKKLPNWHGEHYFEFHRGTFTSHGSIKKGNRHSEILLRDVELVATFASLYKFHKSEYVYPKKTIDTCWEKVLLNQFHDVLPGSGIGMIYEDADKLYDEVRYDGKTMLKDAFDVLFPNSVAALGDEVLKNASPTSTVVGFNTTFFPRRDVVKIPLEGQKAGFNSTVMHSSKDGKTGYGLFDAREGGCLAMPVVDQAQIRSTLSDVSVYTNGSDHFVLRNANVQLTISEGRINSLYDVMLGRELIARGQTGGLVIFEDRPNYWDAWDVEIFHLETPHPLSFSDVTVVAEGPLRASVVATVKFGQSEIHVTISLDAIGATTKPGSRSMFTFDADVEWHQRHEILKFELPLDIHSDNATYETQFGFVQRPTHKNTTWDMAKFEVCGHKFADLSEYGYGVALLSESKYGYACEGNVLRMSLLRAATAPDAEQDQGNHQFSWAVMPHEGHFLESDVPVAAYLFNSPMHMRHVRDAEDVSLLASFQHPFAISGARNVFLETVKRGEDDSFGPHDFDWTSESTTFTIILRLYEAFGGHARAHIQIANYIPVSSAYITNLLEDEGDELNLKHCESAEGRRMITLDFHGFEVKTVKLVIGKGANSVEDGQKKEGWVTVDKSGILIQ